MKRNSILNKALSRALSLKRPHKGGGEQLLLNWIASHAGTDSKFFDACGNLHLDLRVSSRNKTLFVAHVDTVHREDGPNKITKTHTHWYANEAPLGADDGAGVALLMQLIERKVPGYYVFTVGEECGGIGARFLADQYADLLRQFDRAIAFDRRGIDSVITHQGFGRCCSDTFAQEVAFQLAEQSRDALMYLPDDTGVYTDTAEFTDLIPECTNISCGYEREHSVHESLNIQHLVTLANAICRIDWDGLPTERDPSVFESKYMTTSVSSSADGLDWHIGDDTDWEREYLRDALYDAMVGQPHELIDMMCASVYPEDPDLAKRYINAKKLTDELLEEMLQQSGVYDPDTVLCTIYDAIYTGA